MYYITQENFFFFFYIIIGNIILFHLSSTSWDFCKGTTHFVKVLNLPREEITLKIEEIANHEDHEKRWKEFAHVYLKIGEFIVEVKYFHSDTHISDDSITVFDTDRQIRAFNQISRDRFCHNCYFMGPAIPNRVDHLASRYLKDKAVVIKTDHVGLHNKKVGNQVMAFHNYLEEYLQSFF